MIHDSQLHRHFGLAAIRFGGVNNIMDHNEVYNTPLIAVSFGNADNVIEYNVFHDCNINGQDMAAVYGGRNANCQGVIIRYNHFYDLGNGSDYNNGDGGSAIYFDDGLSSATATHNIIGPGASMYQGAVHMNKGHNNVFTNNLLIDMDRMARVARYGETDREFAEYMFSTVDNTSKLVNNEFYISRWPWFAALRDYEQGDKPIYIPNTVANNVLINIDTDLRTGSIFYTEPERMEITGVDSNLYIAKGQYGDNRDLFVDYENGDYRLTEEVLALTDFENIDQSGIGLQTFVYDDKELLPGGNKPVVSDVSIVGTVESGSEIKGAYTFTDADSDAEGTTMVEFWQSDSSDPFYVNWDRISPTGLTNSYIVSPNCEGKWIRCKVIPVDENRVQGKAVWSEPIYVELTTEVDTTELEGLLAEAEEFMEGVVVGEEDGQWKQSYVDTFNAAINVAKAVLAQSTLYPSEYEAALKAFKNAYTTFVNSKIKTATLGYVSVGRLITDTANWKSTNATPVFENGTVSISNVDANKWGTLGYTKETYVNKIFRFTYQQTVDGGCGGFFLDLDEGCGPENLWDGKKISVVIKENQVELQMYGGKNSHSMVTENVNFENGKTYDIAFGMYDISDISVRVVMMVDGVIVLDEEVEDEAYISAESYFCVHAGLADVAIGESTSDVTIETPYVEIGSLLSETENWKATNNTPVFQDGTISVSNVDANKWSTLGYTVETNTNKIYRFAYQQTVDDGGMGGFFLDLDEGCGPEMLWEGKKIAVVIKKDAVELQMYGGATSHSMITKAGTYFENGKTYDVTFGMYDISATSVRIIMTVDGETVLDEEVEDSAYISAPSYFCVHVAFGEVLLGESSSDVPAGNLYVDVSTLISDADNWKGTDVTPVIEDGVMSFTGKTNSTWSIVGYAGASHTNKIYRFKYDHYMTKDKYGGFVLDLDEGCPDYYFRGTKVYVLFHEGEMNLNFVGGATKHDRVDKTYRFENDKTYDIDFGIYDVSATSVRIIMTINGETVYDLVVEDSNYVSKPSYLSMFASEGETIKIH